MVETRAQAKLKNKTVRTSASGPITTDRTALSMGEQAVVEDLMAKQAYRIETSFMAVMDRFSSELRSGEDVVDIVHNASQSRTERPRAREVRALRRKKQRRRLWPYPGVKLRPAFTGTDKHG
ncbi:unnamed protein product [Prunus armeniaca]